MDEPRVHTETRAGDPFTSFAPPQDHPHACNDGWVSMEVETDEGSVEEVLYLCQLCAQRS
jgi:hypothetical protein